MARVCPRTVRMLPGNHVTVVRLKPTLLRSVRPQCSVPRAPHSALASQRALRSVRHSAQG
eukprot:3011711-Prymnesium_polylepis.1